MPTVGLRVAVLAAIVATFLALVTAHAVNPSGAPADHFLSYKTKTTKGTAKFAPVPAVDLANDVESLSVDVKAVGDLLVPVAVSGGAVVDQATHLRGYKIKAVKKSPKHVKRLRTTVVNALGTLLVDTVKPDTLLVPTAEDPATSPPAPDPSSHDVDHYECYLVRVSKGTAKLAKNLQTTVTDPFTQAPKILALHALKHLCLPVDKRGEGINSHAGALACYAATRAKGQPKHVAQHARHVTNQFGALTLDTVKEDELCVPSVFTLASTGVPTPTITPTPHGGSTATPTVVSTAGLPPDPATVAPPVDQEVSTSLPSASAFLYTGPNPIQVGVAPGAIVPQRAAVVRGLVRDGSAGPLPGVTITVLDHPELGQTLSRADGRFDLVVNGGGTLTIDYRRTGRLPAQRQVAVPWQDYVSAPDVILIPLDPQMTPVDLLAATPVQVARGSAMTDADGPRQATLFFPQGTQAEMVMPDGSTQPMTALSVRATEYTVGPNGPLAMPGALPPTSGYTYAVELSVDEAIAAGAASVSFSQPVPFYLENFVGFPVGSLVPTGFYDRATGQWVAADNGRVIKIISIVAGSANLDLDGNGTIDDAAALAALGITDAERHSLATLYAAGHELWRVPIPHFSPWDCNFPFGPPPDSGGPQDQDPKPGPKPDDPLKGKPNKNCGSIIGCEPQTLGEVIAVTGAPFTLRYQSDRVPGRRATRTLKIRLSGATLPPGLQRIHLETQIAGRVFESDYAPQAQLIDTFTWDGKDVYGRAVQGRQPVTVRIGYEYVAQYYATPDSFAASFNRFGAPPSTTARGGGSPISFQVVNARSTTPPIILWQEYESALGSLDDTSVGGWRPSIHHAYDVGSRTLVLGDGDVRTDVGGAILTTTVGTGSSDFGGDGGPANEAELGSPRGLAVGPDGSLYITTADHRIRHVAPDGIITTVAGTGTFGFTGDGGPATQARLSSPEGVAVAADGTLYVADFSNKRVRRVGPDGIITTIAGTGTFGVDGDGGRATQAQLTFPMGVAVAPDGSVYFTEQSNPVVRRIGPDGILTTVAGTGAAGFAGDGGFATLAKLSVPSGLAIGSDGNLFIADTGNSRIRRLGPDGILTTVAGTGVAGFAGDGLTATQAKLNFPTAVAVGVDGSLYVADKLNGRIRQVAPDGTITTVAGTGVAGFAGDGGLATQAQLNVPVGVAVEPDGSVDVADRDNARIRRRPSSLAGSFFAGGLLSIAAEDGSEIYVFTGTGRHFRTLDALTGALRFEFTYDGADRLATIVDGDGDVTTIERDGSGHASAIVAPFGRRTNLATDADGYLSSVTNPAGESVQLTYAGGTAAGLLATRTDPRGNVHHYLYDALGRLVRDEDPAGGMKVLARTDPTDDHYAITLTTAAGLVTTFEVEELPTGDASRVRIDPSGARTESLVRADGSRRVTYPDGTVAEQVEGPDPRFGMQAPILQTLTVTTPGGTTGSRSTVRTATLADPNDPLSLIAQTDTVTVNGKVYTTTYTAATRTMVTTTPTGRDLVTTLNAKGRVATQGADAGAGLTPVSYAYDAHGRLLRLEQVPQSWDFGYDAQHRLSARTDAAGGATAYGYDAADRPTTITLPSARGYGFGYDLSGNRTAVTMPDLGVHQLVYGAIDQPERYAPPGNSAYVTSYDTDRRVDAVVLPSGRTESFSYDGGNRATGLSYPEAAVVLTYANLDQTPRVAHLSNTQTGGAVAQDLAFTYDGDLVTGATWSGAASGAYTYTYDADFLLKSIALSSGIDTVTTNLTRDASSLLTAVGPFTLVRGGPAGDPTQIGDGTLVVTLGYDALGRLANRVQTVAGQQKYALQVSYDTVGRISSRVETLSGTTRTYDYAYDADGQLTGVERDGVIVERYAYDANRNRTSRRLSQDPAVTATYDGQDRVTQNGATTYQVDVDGYLTQRGSDTFQYDTTGALLQASVGGQTVTYAYDGLRRRVRRTRAGNTTQYLYGNPDDALQITHSRDPQGVLSTYYYDEGRRLFALERDGDRYYVATDHLGSPRIVTDTAGVAVKVVTYDGFGVTTSDTDPSFVLPVGFAGGLVDDTTRLVRFGFRDYEPLLGRWTARDQAVFGGGQANLYAYVGNDPVSVIDPVGLGGAGVGLCEGICVGVKLGYEPGKGISACFEAGFGVGNSIEIDPFKDLDDSGVSLEAKAGVKAGIGKLEIGVDIGECANVKPKAEACVGPICAKAGDGRFKDKLSLDENGRLQDVFKGGGFGLQGKVVGKICQQASW